MLFKSEQFELGKTLLEILNNYEEHIEAICQGKGTCKKCRVIATGNLSEMSEVEKKALTETEIENNVRLACMCKAQGDFEYTPYTDTNILVDKNLKDITGINLNKKGFGIAFDIGTTTIAGYLLELETGKILNTVSQVNSQRSFGADVIARINYCMENKNGLPKLRKLIVKQLNNIIEKLSDNKNISEIVIAGNTTMLHLLAGLNPDTISFAPFTTKYLFGLEYNAKDLDLNTKAKVYLFDCISAYVGGDISAGMLACDMDKSEDYILLVDVGTNGEMAFGNKDEIYCCATAAGPAFEGAHIKYGCAGIDGAIDNVFFIDGEIKVSTINNKEQIGICGSGIINAVNFMLQNEIIDETGRIVDTDELSNNYFIDRITTSEEKAFLLDTKSKISITQKDVREVQLAKAAVYAGIVTLLEKAGKTIEDISKICIAGGFGAHIDIISAVGIGLFPKEALKKAEYIGNAAGSGASMVLLSEDCKKRVKNITSKCKYIELSNSPEFMDHYVDSMTF